MLDEAEDDLPPYKFPHERALDSLEALDDMCAKDNPEPGDYPSENGRRYHRYRAGRYNFPNDQIEIDRLNLQHRLLRVVQNGVLHSAPLEDPKAILDLGTGTAAVYPAAVVIGNDLSPIQMIPDPRISNVQFEMTDFEDIWEYKPDTFDFIYGRYLLGSVTSWGRLLSQAYRALRPGGYLELLEPLPVLQGDDGPIDNTSTLALWNDNFIHAAKEAHRPVDIAPMLKETMELTGFVDVHQDVLRLRNGGPGQNYSVNVDHMPGFPAGLEGSTLKLFTRYLGDTPGGVREFLAEVKKDLRRFNHNTYCKL
ncbi:hypothetical protein TWF696_003448 [Orbilia brochopaga]|uniref:Methyltransferase n=1 Tax=Orbilia brochopaga TaxID=3140254 RepID=A0AAV9TX69_9PEZI